MRRLALSIALATAAAGAAADTPPAVPAADHAPGAPAAAASGTQQFDFLLGQWSLQVHPKVSSLAAMIHGSPQLAGSWRAWRVLDGRAIEDELRIVDSSGNPLTAARSLRLYADAEARWHSTGVDAYHGRAGTASGRFEHGEMRLEGQSTDPDGHATLTRTRFFDISADAFHMQQDRSTDNGQTWDEGVLTIEAKRRAASADPA